MSELEILPVGAVIVSPKTGRTLMRSHNGWMHAPSGAVCVCIAVTEELFEEAEKVPQMTIVEFLEARIAEDEAAANSHYRDTDKLDGYEVIRSLEGMEVRRPGQHRGAKMGYQEFADRFLESVPDKRLLAECAAKRALVDLYRNGGMGEVFDGEKWTNPLAAFAAVYADHPDYQQEWTL